ncbi:MAG: DUF1211 domain-containing protein [Actinobacteria bacterium]|nr:DUF1211 domain-containing protein [Actinomycetota bacterium]
MPTSRLEAFSDGVLAVAITLLVLDLHVSDDKASGSLAHQIADQWPKFIAYLVSFLVIGVIWVNHHRVFALAARIDPVTMFVNLILLMSVSTIPFTTSAIAEFLRSGGNDSRLAVLLYGASMEGMSLSFSAVFYRLCRQGLLRRPVTRSQANRAILRFGAGNAIYPVGVLIGLLSPVAMLIIFGLLAAYYALNQTPIVPDADESGIEPEPDSVEGS